ncbi:hypothetical protein OSTOST_02110, partial [Ostertagia ostertagi]
TTQIIRYLTTSEPCNVGLPPLICISIRYSSTSCMVCFAALQLNNVLCGGRNVNTPWKVFNGHRACCSAMETSALRALQLTTRNNFGIRFGADTYYITESQVCDIQLILLLFQIVVSFAITAWVVQNVDFSTRTFYCSTVTEKTVNRATILTYGLCGIDVITLLGIISLYIFNNYAMKRFRRSFSLQSYQLRENANVIRVMLPLTIFQTICFFVFSYRESCDFCIPSTYVINHVSCAHRGCV